MEVYEKGECSAAYKRECVQVGEVSLAECIGVYKSITSWAHAEFPLAIITYWLKGGLLAVQILNRRVFTLSPYKLWIRKS